MLDTSPRKAGNIERKDRTKANQGFEVLWQINEIEPWGGSRGT